MQYGEFAKKNIEQNTFYILLFINDLKKKQQEGIKKDIKIFG
jgi:hypothetical protein